MASRGTVSKGFAFVFIIGTFLSQSDLGAAVVTGLHSIKAISKGTTLNFENAPYLGNPSVVLKPYGITTDSNTIGVYLSWITGNADAPYNDHVVINPRTFSTSVPWSSVGFSAAPGDYPGSDSFAFSAYDQFQNLIYSDSHLFVSTYDPNNYLNTQLSYNNAVFFFGVTSTTPIWSVHVSSSNSNYGIDSFTFTTAPVPEPGSLALLLAAGLLVRRRATVAAS